MYITRETRGLRAYAGNFKISDYAGIFADSKAFLTTDVLTQPSKRWKTGIKTLRLLRRLNHEIMHVWVKGWFPLGKTALSFGGRCAEPCLLAVNFIENAKDFVALNKSDNISPKVQTRMRSSWKIGLARTLAHYNCHTQAHMQAM